MPAADLDERNVLALKRERPKSQTYRRHVHGKDPYKISEWRNFKNKGKSMRWVWQEQEQILQKHINLYDSLNNKQ